MGIGSMTNHLDQRRHLDFLFLVDAIFSLTIGTVALGAPHGFLRKVGGGKFVKIVPQHSPMGSVGSAFRQFYQEKLCMMIW